MAVDKSYGSGYKNTGMSKATVSKQKLAKAPKSVTPAKRKTATALLTKKRADLAISRSPNKNTPAAPMIGELSKMLTGVGTDAKGKFGIDPMGLAMALPLGKVVKAAAGLRAAGKIGKAAALEARIAAKVGGQIAKRASAIGNAGRGPFSAANFAKENAAIKSITNRDITAAGARAASESLFPKLPNMGYVPGATRTFDRYADPLSEGAGRIFPGIAKRIPKPKLPKGRGGR